MTITWFSDMSENFEHLDNVLRGGSSTIVQLNDSLN